MAQQPPVPDYYDILGTKPVASRIEIQRCFRKIQRIWRSRAKSGIGGLIMAAAEEAYETLKDPEKKRYYDAEYQSITMAWKKFHQRKMVAAQADDEISSDDSSDLDEDEDGEKDQDGDEKADDEDDTDDGGPDGEAEDDDYTDRESSDDEIVVAIRPRNSVVVVDSEDEESDAEFTDGEEPESDDDAMDETVDRYAHYCTGYAEDTDSESESDDEGHYAIQLRSGRWVDRNEHYAHDPNHETCELEED